MVILKKLQWDLYIFYAIQVVVIVIAEFTTPGESHLYGLPLSLCRLFGPHGPFLYL